MKTSLLITCILISAILILMLGVDMGFAQQPGYPEGVNAPQGLAGTAFTYQGQLKKAGVPVSLACDFQFTLYNAALGGSPDGTQQDKPGISVTGGLFSVKLDFGSGAFNGEARWLGILVKCPPDPTYTDLGRHELTPAPLALALPGLWTQQNATSPNLIGGHSGNWVTSGVYGATINGGGGGGFANRVTDHYGVVGGGSNNAAGNTDATLDNALYATIGGGYTNNVSAPYATVGGGESNQANAEDSTVGGGSGNQASSPYSTVGGGEANQVSGYAATIGGGGSNQASALSATISGGYNNQANGNYATVGGGGGNQASSLYATVPGGNNNTAAGNYSFTAGRRAKANNDGCFVWGDASDSNISCNNDNRWVACASGGVYFYTNSALSSGMYLDAGGSSWNVASSRTLKQDFQAVDAQKLLTHLSDIPISTWSYKAQVASIRHIGPMADDFNGLLPGLGGEGMQSINRLDADGVALAAIQGLYQRSKELEAENAALRQQVQELDKRVAALEQARGVSRSPQATQSNAGLLLAGLALAGVAVGWQRTRRSGDAQ